MIAFLLTGRRSKLRIKEDTLAIQLREDNTVVLEARVAVEVAARTWIWKGVNFGFLGCLKMNSCNGQIVTYSADVDFQVRRRLCHDDMRHMHGTCALSQSLTI